MIKCINKQIHKYIGYMNECTYNTYIYIYIDMYTIYIYIAVAFFTCRFVGMGLGGLFCDDFWMFFWENKSEV